MIEECHLKGAEVLVKEAKREHASRRATSNENLSRATKEGISFYDRAPVTLVLDFTGWRPRSKKLECFVCKARGGTFYIEDGRAFCETDKGLMRLPEDELNRIIKERKRKGAKNVKKYQKGRTA